ncbi:MAG: OmpH family outer membrane protein [Planctomycetota bacterium]
MQSTKSSGRVGLLAGLVLGAAGIAGVGVGLGAGVVQRMADPTAVAVVDIDRVSSELEEFNVRVESLAGKRDARVTELREISTRIEEINVELGTLTDEEEDRAIQLAIERQVLQSDLQTKQQAYQSEADLMQGRLTRELYVKIVEATGRIAERDGYDLVVFDDRSISIDDPQAASFAGSLATIKSKKVLYASDVVDLTPSVLALMNNEFAAGG